MQNNEIKEQEHVEKNTHNEMENKGTKNFFEDEEE